MPNLRHLAVPGPVAVFLLLGSAANQLSFHAEEETVLRKVFHASVLLELDEASLSVDGNDMSEAIPLSSFELEASILLVTSDEYREVENGHPVQLVRDFEEVVLAYETPDDQDSQHLENIEGVRVLFQWNEEQGDYEASLTDDSEEIDPGFMRVLLEDMDLRAILPGKDVSEGDAWEVAGSAIAGILLPGLRGAGVAELAEQKGEVPGAILEQLGTLPDGLEMYCEYKGQREEAETVVAVIEISLEGSASLELADVLGDEIDVGEGVTPEIEQSTVELLLDGEGVLLWDIEAGHMLSFSIDAEIEIELVVSASVEVQGESHQLDGTVVVVGDLEWSADFSDD